MSIVEGVSARSATTEEFVPVREFMVERLGYLTEEYSSPDIDILVQGAISSPDSEIVVATRVDVERIEQARQVLGSVGLWFEDHPHTGDPRAYLSEFAIDPAYRGEGAHATETGRGQSNVRFSLLLATTGIAAVRARPPVFAYSKVNTARGRRTPEGTHSLHQSYLTGGWENVPPQEVARLAPNTAVHRELGEHEIWMKRDLADSYKLYEDYIARQ